MVLPDFDLETVSLIPDEIIMSSATELTQYFIKEWRLEFEDQGVFRYICGSCLIDNVYFSES